MAINTQEDLIFEVTKLTKPKTPNSKRGNISDWEEPAFHNPKLFVSMATHLNPTNLTTILGAFTDSWKIDVLRAVRNYFAHRSKELEHKSKSEVLSHYLVNDCRAYEILMQNDHAIAAKPIEDIHRYLIALSVQISH